jgi:hypothetical protein
MVIVGTVALAVLGLAWLVWVTVVHSRPLVSSKLVGFDVPSEHVATARFAVTRRESDVPASCLLRAYAEDHAIVGERSMRVAAGHGTRMVEASLRTERRATAVEVVGCTAPGQQQRR